MRYRSEFYNALLTFLRGASTITLLLSFTGSGVKPTIEKRFLHHFSYPFGLFFQVVIAVIGLHDAACVLAERDFGYAT